MPKKKMPNPIRENYDYGEDGDFLDKIRKRLKKRKKKMKKESNTDLIRGLVKISNELDGKGLFKEADYLDRIIKTAFEETEEQRKEREKEEREGMQRAIEWAKECGQWDPNRLYEVIELWGDAGYGEIAGTYKHNRKDKFIPAKDNAMGYTAGDFIPEMSVLIYDDKACPYL